MTDDQESVSARRAGKHHAILDGALEVFAHDGYSRTSIDAIAATAGVSTRTIYNHFSDKAQLFERVIRRSAGHVAEAQIELIDRHLRKVTDVEADLVELGLALVRPIPGSQAHFALVRQVEADAEHIPEEAMKAWHETGPRRVRRALGERLTELNDLGLLRVDDAERAAWHFLLLVSGPLGDRDGTDAVAEGVVRSGVRAFLYGYTT